MKKALKIVGFIVGSLLLGSLAFGTIKLIEYIKDDNKQHGAVEAPVVDEMTATEDEAPEISEGEPLNYVAVDDVSVVVDRVMPSIVSIECTSTVESYSLFGGSVTQDVVTGGTGFLVSQSKTKLFICTNQHVIASAKTIKVTFDDGEACSAMLVGEDKEYDLAIISVKIDDLCSTTINKIRISSIGNSDNLSVGDLDIAIGNAMGTGQSVTVGYISALDREITVDSVTRKFIQTDAAINPGNSGGPLLNIYGQVIGINSAKHSETTVEGIGYAIPISKAVPIINEIFSSYNIKDDEVGYLGIEGKDVDDSYASAFLMPKGVYVYSIKPNSSVIGTGLEVGDIITAVNGREVLTMASLTERVSHIRAGETVTITAKCPEGNKYVEKEFSVVLDKRPANANN